MLQNVRRIYAHAKENPAATLSILTLGLGATASYFNEDRRAKIKLNLDSSFKVFNFVLTALVASIDYGLEFNWRKVNINNLSDYEKKERKLEECQNLQEEYIIQLIQTQDPTQIEVFRNLVSQKREEINAIVQDMSHLSKENSQMNTIHLRNATRLRDMCASNGGVYIKLGQHLSMLDHIFPAEYPATLSALLSATPQSNWKSIRRVFKEDIGKYPEEIFTSIDPIPIASASLAQVHLAVGKDGRKYAVKVQHEGLQESSRGDRKIITFIIQSIPYWFKQVNYDWIAEQMNENLPKELDFNEEKKNLQRCAANLSSLIESGDVALPKIHESLSSSRVLTMTFEEGCYISDLDKIESMKLNSADISRIVSTVFCEQIYRHGFVHCGE